MMLQTQLSPNVRIQEGAAGIFWKYLEVSKGPQGLGAKSCPFLQKILFLFEK